MRCFKKQKRAPFQRNSLSSTALARAASGGGRGGFSRLLQIFLRRFRLPSRSARTANRRGVCTSRVRKHYIWIWMVEASKISSRGAFRVSFAWVCGYTLGVLAIPKTMRAVVYRGVNDLRVETVPVPRIQSDELLVQVAACGVCPTDIKKIQYGTVPPPRIFGHETAGTITRVGARLKGFRIGERVALHHHVPCLDCHACRHRAF